MSFDAAAFTQVLLGANLRVAVLLALIYAGLRLLPSGAGAFRHSVWLTAICGCLFMPLLSRALPALPLPALPLPELPLTVTRADLPPAYEPTLPVVAASAGQAASAVPLLVAALVYIVGVIAVLASFGLAVLRISRLHRRLPGWPDPRMAALTRRLSRDLGIRRRVDILNAGGTGSPYTWGVVRPSIVLPGSARGWSPARIQNALVHELGHIKRFDCLRLGLLRLTAAVYWFNPLVWLALRECRYEAERACDDFVLQRGGESSEYAEQLVDLMESARHCRGIGIALGRSYAVERVRSILNAPNRGVVMSKTRLAFVIAVTASLAAVVAVGQAPGQTSEPEAERRRQLAELETLMALQATEQRQQQDQAAARAIVETRARQLAQRSLALRQTESELERVQAALRELEVSLELRTAELIETEQALRELRAELETVDESE